ncbi:hypothetical protein KAT63_03965 [Candidatus Parcubacteria bacterium]|nr:hypothetical protein [Candidatus Parcubacteria bacterium]
MKKNKYLAFVISFAILAGAGLVLAPASSAQEQKRGIMISPLTFDLTANPGDVLKNKLRIINMSDNVTPVTINIENFKAVGEIGQVIIAPVEEEMIYSLKNWMKAEANEFILGPNEQKVVDFMIEVPLNAEPGGKYGSILASIGGENATGGMGTSVVQQVGSLVLLVVSGEVKENLEIKSFSTPSFLEYGPVPFEIKFENKGSIHVKPRGFISISSWGNKKEIDLELPLNNVMPGAVRKIETNWDTKWLFGKYTATIVGGYGTSNIPINPMTIEFWVLPWKLMLAVFIVLAIILIILFLSRKRLRMAAKILLKGEHHATRKDS